MFAHPSVLLLRCWLIKHNGGLRSLPLHTSRWEVWKISPEQEMIFQKSKYSFTISIKPPTANKGWLLLLSSYTVFGKRSPRCLTDSPAFGKIPQWMLSSEDAAKSQKGNKKNWCLWSAETFKYSVSFKVQRECHLWTSRYFLILLTLFSWIRRTR